MTEPYDHLAQMVDEDRKHLLWRAVDATTWRCAGCGATVNGYTATARDYARAWHRLHAVASRMADA